MFVILAAGLLTLGQKSDRVAFDQSEWLFVGLNRSVRLGLLISAGGFGVNVNGRFIRAENSSLSRTDLAEILLSVTKNYERVGVAMTDLRDVLFASPQDRVWSEKRDEFAGWRNDYFKDKRLAEFLIRGGRFLDSSLRKQGSSGADVEERVKYVVAHERALRVPDR
jgi:hypothetical protein